MGELFADIGLLDILRAVLLAVVLILLGYIAFKRSRQEPKHRVMDEAFSRSNILVIKNALDAMNGVAVRINAALAAAEVEPQWDKLAKGAHTVLAGLVKLPPAMGDAGNDEVAELYGKCCRHFGAIAALIAKRAHGEDDVVMEKLNEKLRKFAKNRNRLINRLHCILNDRQDAKQIQ